MLHFTGGQLTPIGVTMTDLERQARARLDTLLRDPLPCPTCGASTVVSSAGEGWQADCPLCPWRQKGIDPPSWASFAASDARVAYLMGLILTREILLVDAEERALRWVERGSAPHRVWGLCVGQGPGTLPGSAIAESGSGLSYVAGSGSGQRYTTLVEAARAVCASLHIPETTVGLGGTPPEASP